MQLLDDIKTRECRAFALAWQDWRGAELVPRRAQVQIDQIKKLLPMLVVLEIVSPELAWFRLAGTAITEVMGADLTGKNYFDMVAPETRDLGVARTCQAAAQPCGSHFIHPIVHQSGRTVPTEVLSLPVLPNDPAAPPQFFTISVQLEDSRLEGSASEQNQFPVIEGYQFVDIGAGVPDPGLNLADRPPATLNIERRN